MHMETCATARPCSPHPGYRVEDGTISFLDVIALKHGFDALEHLTGRGTCIPVDFAPVAHVLEGAPAGV